MITAVIGATGLIGSILLDELLKDSEVPTVRILIRRPIKFTHPRLEKKLVDFDDAESFRLSLEGCHTVFCAVGTTRKKVKSDNTAYRKVDYDIPVSTARFCKMTGCARFILVSSVGANSKSKNFYLKLKGEVEDAVKALGLTSVHIMRPSVLLGKRKESRMGEFISKKILSALSFLIPSKYKPIKGSDVAKAMVKVSKNKQEGFFIYHYTEIIKIIST